MSGGLSEQKIARVVGMGPSQPLLPEAPLDPRNRRISILVLTQEAEERMTRSIAGTEAAPAPTPVPTQAPPPAAPAAAPAQPAGATLGAVALPPLPNLAPPPPAGR